MTDVRVLRYHYRYSATDITTCFITDIARYSAFFLAIHCTDIALDIVINLVREEGPSKIFYVQYPTELHWPY